ncbi:hypothetical protein NBRC10512_004892 [Rhodotorula toruloides]|uniref:RIO-like kinase domain containing protein n=1 Tax=Rhodotorula toruloides (strain NP11) TaxID=1130832 RepID=M7X349_RHOT1|nr:RIO-like kinase domain containing protein [Rhodotorula toruloides NP11]EMS24540.1 RIO-like kinase domain containing protein [Rhodotorula toruloides NP11]
MARSEGGGSAVTGARARSVSRRNLEDIELILSQPFPARPFDPGWTTSEQTQGLSRPFSESTQRHARLAETMGGSGGANGIPLSTVEFDEVASSNVPDTLVGLVDDLTAERARAGKTTGPVPDFHARRPDTRVCSYVDVDYLRSKLMSELAITADCLSLLRADEGDEVWDVCGDFSGTKMATVAADIVATIKGREWEGGALLLQAISDQAFRSVRDSMAARKVWPPLAVVDEPDKGGDGKSKGRGTVTCWDADRAEWVTVPEDLKLALQIVSIISTRTRRSVALGVKVPVILLPVLTGSLLFFAGGYDVDIDGVEYFRLCLSQMYDLNGVPLRKILAAVSLLNISHEPLRLPDLFDPAIAADSDVMPDEIGWTDKAKAALAGLRARQRPGLRDRTSGSACDKGERAERSRTSTNEASTTNVGGSGARRTDYHAVLPDIFQLVHNGGNPFLRQIYERISTDSTLTSMSDTNTSPTPSTSRASSTPPRSDTSAPSSAAPSPPQYPLVKLDTLVYSRDHLRICECTELGVVFKLAWYGDDEVEELEHESAIYEALYRLPAASRFLAPYVGTYEWFGIRLAVVTGSGAEVGEWRQHSDKIINVVSRLHDAGYIHGDLAARNVLQFPDGLRLIDLGRARKADARDRALEMKELRLVLAGVKDAIDYEGMFSYPCNR